MFSTESNSDGMSRDEIESLDSTRRKLILAVAITTTLWFAPVILRGIFGDAMPRPLQIGLVAAGVVSALAYVVLMLRFHRFQTTIHNDPVLRRRLDDERILEIRKNAIVRGWGTLVVAIGLGVAVAPFVDLPDQAVLLTLLLLAVNVPIVSFLIMDRA